MFAQLNLVRLCLTIVLATLAVALAGAQSATAISAPVVIDAVSVENGVAVVTGFVDAELVEVNGQLVEVAENGAFSAPVDISADALVLEILESPNELVTITVPIASQPVAKASSLTSSTPESRSTGRPKGSASSTVRCRSSRAGSWTTPTSRRSR